MRRFACMPLLALLAIPVSATCPPAGQSRESLQALKAQEFKVPAGADRQALMFELLDCLGDPDPLLRDGIAYEALTSWMRAGIVDAVALRGLRDRLQAMLAAADPAGFRQPFAALVLSEVARTDRIAPWMTREERHAMVEAAASYLESIRDYRGFDESEGWRHGVAHGADWLLQLSLNPALERAQTDRLLAAIAVQAVPEAAHAYVHGEPGRLARPLLFIAKRGLYSAAEWQAWFAALPRRLGDASKPGAVSAQLVRRHDLLAFLMHLYLEAGRADDTRIKELQPAIVASLQLMP